MRRKSFLRYIRLKYCQTVFSHEAADIHSRPKSRPCYSFRLSNSSNRRRQYRPHNSSRKQSRCYSSMQDSCNQQPDYAADSMTTVNIAEIIAAFNWTWGKLPTMPPVRNTPSTLPELTGGDCGDFRSLTPRTPPTSVDPITVPEL